MTMFLKLTFISLLFLLIPCININAQDSLATENLLIVRKRNSSKRKYYNVNSSIIFKTKDTLHYGTIKEITFDSLLIDSTWTNYSSINTIIDPNGKHFLKQGSVLFPIAGVTFFFITTLNALVNNDSPIFYRENLIPSAGLIGLGAIMWPFRIQKYRLKRNWELIVIPS